ncbi:MAG TPA: hypothetical protein VGH51_01415 [Candidatus Angelobacter sp.]
MKKNNLPNGIVAFAADDVTNALITQLGTMLKERAFQHQCEGGLFPDPSAPPS